MAGSVLLMHQPSLSAMWDRIRADVYYTAGVWDRDAVRVHEFIPAPAPAPAAPSGGTGAGEAKREGEE
jgi:hypothetical protein